MKAQYGFSRLPGFGFFLLFFFSRRFCFSRCFFKRSLRACAALSLSRLSTFFFARTSLGCVFVLVSGAGALPLREGLGAGEAEGGLALCYLPCSTRRLLLGIPL